jgi:hypothetical protein
MNCFTFRQANYLSYYGTRNNSKDVLRHQRYCRLYMRSKKFGNSSGQLPTSYVFVDYPFKYGFVHLISIDGICLCYIITKITRSLKENQFQQWLTFSTWRKAYLRLSISTITIRLKEKIENTMIYAQLID